MSLMLDIAVVSLCLLIVGAFVWLALRLILRSVPRTGKRRTLIRVVQSTVPVALVLFGFEFQLAYGTPTEERTSEVFEVVEVRECRRAFPFFGVNQTCALGAYRYEGEWPPDSDRPGEIFAVDGIGPGDRVAQFAAYDTPRWRSLDDLDRPNLDWLPWAAGLLSFAFVAGVEQYLRRSRSGEVDAGELLGSPR